jgi:hypothetical protein
MSPILAVVLLALAPPIPPPAADPPPSGRSLELIEELRTLHHKGSATTGERDLLKAHHELLGLFWSSIADDGQANLPEVTLLGAGERFTACGRAPASNAYCPESAELGIDHRGLLRRLRLQSSPSPELSALTVLAHEWGHHINQAISQGPYEGREEDAADWRAGRYLGWLIDQQVLPVEDYTEAANILFRIGDYHQLSPHGYPLNRFRAFIKGVRSELPVGSQVGPWTMDTEETFSQVVKQNRSQPWVDSTLKVYRFEIERGSQIAGNFLKVALGVFNCGFGSGRACAGSLASQGQAKPDGWFRLRTMRLNCHTGFFDIEGDGIARQRISRDRKGQAQRIAQRICGPTPDPSALDVQEFNPLP